MANDEFPIEKLRDPCIRNCCLDREDICMGCFRSLDDILRWSKSSREEKVVMLREAEARKAARNSAG